MNMGKNLKCIEYQKKAFNSANRCSKGSGTGPINRDNTLFD